MGSCLAVWSGLFGDVVEKGAVGTVLTGFLAIGLLYDLGVLIVFGNPNDIVAGLYLDR